MPASNVLEMESETSRYCMKCCAFLAVGKFKTGPKRWICRRHYNEKWNTVKMELWKKRPQNKQANITWQMAYKDSVSVFLSKIEITPAQVLALLRDNDIPLTAKVRLLPLNPTKPLAMENCWLVSLEIRKLICRVWKQSRCINQYNNVMGHYQTE